MTRWLRALIVPMLAAAIVLCASAQQALGEKPPAFSYPTKIMNLETGYLLGPGGKIQIGLGESGFGAKERMQFTTNTLFDAIGFLNAQLKLGVLTERDRRPALAVGFGFYKLLTAGYMANRLMETMLDEEDLSLDAGLDIYSLFASVSKQINPRFRIHLGYQYQYLDGHAESDDPIDFVSDGDTLSAYISVEQTQYHRCFVGGMDADLHDRVKLLGELGYDVSMEQMRGGVGLRFGLSQILNLQVGILLPGIKLGDDLDIPVVPHLTFFARF